MQKRFILFLIAFYTCCFFTVTTNVAADRLWIDPHTPQWLREEIVWDGELSNEITSADYIFSITAADQPGTDWLYLLVAPYPESSDNLHLSTLKTFWQEGKYAPIDQLLVTEDTKVLFSQLWGEPARGVVETDSSDLLQNAWQQEKTWAMIPFEQADPRWKVIQINGISPFDLDFDPTKYLLKAHFALQSNENETECQTEIPDSNYDPNKRTTLTLSGTTAIARNLAYHIEIDGLDYPAKNIAPVLAASDITHISNESSFYADCPPAVPLRGGSRFCSDPAYLDILRQVGADVVELTGNHILDWGQEAFLYSLDLYQKEGFQVYGGGLTAEAGQEALLLEHNGNKIALLGCNAIGPQNILATEDYAGAAPCDMEKLTLQIESLRSEGWLPVVTFQHLEYTWYDTISTQSRNFYEAAQAGAVIVSGSQAHIPQGMAFVGRSFIHFGLGNLLFDQMNEVERNSFFDRHVFYDGRYIGNVLETIRLEDYSQPRFLTQPERHDFLNLIFGYSQWDRTFDEH